MLGVVLSDYIPLQSDLTCIVESLNRKLKGSPLHRGAFARVVRLVLGGLDQKAQASYTQ